MKKKMRNIIVRMGYIIVYTNNFPIVIFITTITTFSWLIWNRLIYFVLCIRDVISLLDLLRLMWGLGIKFGPCKETNNIDFELDEIVSQAL